MRAQPSATRVVTLLPFPTLFGSCWVEPVTVARRRLQLVAQCRQPLPGLAPRAERMFHRHQFGRQTAELVLQATMAARVEQPPVIVLAMYLHQQRSQVDRKSVV